MQEKSRKKNSIRNLMYGVLYQVLNLVCSFVCRTLLIHYLGEEILGINSLYTDILYLLSLAELGIGNIMLVKLYKPIADDDKETITAYTNYYKKIYNIIALIIFCLGLLVVPFLSSIVSNEIQLSNRDLVIYFLIFLLNTVSSYFVAYKQTLVNASQQSSTLKMFNMIALVLKTILRLVILLTIKDYKLYLAVDLISNLTNNITVSIYVDKKYPYLKNKNTLNNEQKKDIKIGIKDIFLYKIGATLINNTDSIIISAILGTLTVGYLSNYNLILTALNGFLGCANTAIFASIGNMSVSSDANSSYKIFKSCILIYHIIGAFCGITLVCVFNDFIYMWLGNSYVLGMEVVIALSFNFYFSTSIAPIHLFRENYGLFSRVKYLLIIAAAVNVISSIVLAYLLGLVGVIIGTILCRLTTTFVFEPPYLCKTVFNRSSKDYFLTQLKMFLVTIVCLIACYFACIFIPVNIGLFFVKIIICFAIIVTIFSLVFARTTEYKYLINLIKDIWLNLKNKLKKTPTNEIYENNTQK